MFSANASQVSNDVKYIEDFCSVYLRTGTGSSQTVTTGVKENTGALVISKSRSAATDWAWYDTFRGATKELASNTTAAEITQSQGMTSFNTDGHTWGTLAKVNTSGDTYVDFVLKPTPKFFDVVTWTGDGIAGRVIPHNLGSVPGCVIGKRTSATSDWTVYHRSLNGGTNPDQYQVLLNTTAAQSGPGAFLLAAAPTSTGITLVSAFNQIGVTYVAYVFAHNAGGFGLTGTDNVISCGSVTSDASGNATLNLGYEPQWLLIKKTSSTGFWAMLDTMRGWPSKGVMSTYLQANAANAESNYSTDIYPTATGINFDNGSLGPSATYIYIAIRRGPMKTPTTGTQVFDVNDMSSVTASTPPLYRMSGGAGFTGPDMLLNKVKGSVSNWQLASRLTSGTFLDTTSTAAQTSDSSWTWDYMNGVRNIAPSSVTILNYFFRRAPGFFDVVCYTGTGVARTVAHNLGVVPEMLIFKRRDAIRNWAIVHANAVNRTVSQPPVLTGYDVSMNFTVTGGLGGVLNSTAPTSSVVTLSSSSDVNASGGTYVAYLFATVPGVSKCGGYTGTGTTQQINCGFTAGSRFVLIKRTDDVGDWYVWDSARGIVAGNDPYLLLNSTAAEVTSTDYIDTYSAGFEISSTAPAAINASGGSYIYLAIA